MCSASTRLCGTTIYGPNPEDPTGDEIAVGCDRDGFHLQNSQFVKKNFNVNKTWGGRAALKIDLDDNWTVTPTIMHQNSHAEGVFFEDAALGDLEVQRYRKEPTRDKFTQYALTVEGKIGNFDLTYAGAYMHRPNVQRLSDYTEYTYAYDVAYENNQGSTRVAYYYYFRTTPATSLTHGNTSLVATTSKR